MSATCSQGQGYDAPRRNVRFSAQISRLVKRADFDLARSRHRTGAAPRPGDGFFHVLDLPQPETGNQFPSFGERPIDDGAVGAIERDALPVRRRLDAENRGRSRTENRGRSRINGELRGRSK